MLELNNWVTQAIQKLKDGKKGVSGSKEKAMVHAVSSALQDFCKQDQEFAQAVVQGGSLADCMAAVAKGVGNSISDIDVYKKAVQFYFPGAKVQMQLTIDLIGDAAGEAPAPEKPAVIALNLEDFF